MKNLYIVGLILALSPIFSGCQQETQTLQNGVWRGVLFTQGKELPFNFAVVDRNDHQVILLKNAGEHLELDELSFWDDSLRITMHIFDAELVVKNWGDSLTGYFTKNFAANYKIPFKAVFDQDFRFSVSSNAAVHVGGKWQVKFYNEEEEYKAVGLLTQIQNQLTGTFLTETGDYRFLEGQVSESEIQLSTFDGDHVYLFEATLDKDTLRGEYWSGMSGHYFWEAFRDSTAALTDADSLTYVQPNGRLEFTFPNTNGHPVSLDDPPYQHKVVIVQLLGTWCPNCLDETKFLSKWYKDNRHRNIEIIGLAYEAKDDFEYASKRVRKMKEKLGVEYEILIAGTKDKQEASKTLPTLNGIQAFPTTVFIDKSGVVYRIHTGFTGPGTGDYYNQFISEFNKTIDKLSVDTVKRISQ